VALAPAAVLRAWAAGPLPVVVLVVGGVAAYPWLLAGFGALVEADLARLRAIEAALPSPVRALTSPLLSALNRWARVPAPAG
jgi:hypothetical protein